MLWSVQNQPMGNVKSTAIAERDPSHTLNKVSSLFIQDLAFFYSKFIRNLRWVTFHNVACERTRTFVLETNTWQFS